VDKDEAERENNEYSNHEKNMTKHFPALLLDGNRGHFLTPRPILLTYQAWDAVITFGDYSHLKVIEAVAYSL